MDLFVCGTAYQLLNILSISAAQSSQSDVIITDPSMRQICDAQKIKHRCNIRQVYIWDQLAMRITYRKIRNPIEHYLNNLNKAILYSQTHKIYRSLPNKNRHYNRIFVGNTDFPAMCIYYFFKKKGASLSLYEEGAFTYNCMVIRTPFIRKLVSYLLFGGCILEDCQEIWVRSKEQTSLGDRKDVRLIQIPDNLHMIRQHLMDIFYYDKKQLKMLDKKIILFDEVHEVNDVYKVQQEAAEKLDRCFGKDFVIKYHPGVSRGRYRDGIQAVHMGLPFEVLLGMFSMEKRILLSLFSTACFSPKILYDQEPYVIFLYKLMHWKNPFQFEKEVEKLKKRYRRPERIMEPETMEEMIRYISRIRKQDEEMA